MTFYIYGLFATGEWPPLVRYVGKTKMPLIRFQQHCRGIDAATGDWVRAIENKISIVIFERCTEPTQARLAEVKWIEKFPDLLNNHHYPDNHVRNKRLMALTT